MKNALNKSRKEHKNVQNTYELGYLLGFANIFLFICFFDFVSICDLLLQTE